MTHAASCGGVLSQTLASSPCIKSILPARIRSPSLNDVVFVAHSSIHLREFTQDGHLGNVIAELELDVQILAAAVISAEAHVLSTEDTILENGRDEVRFKIRGAPCDDSQPPQIVVLTTSTSQYVFIYARSLTNGEVQFVHARRDIMGGKAWPGKYGKHLVVDPESRAMVVAASRGSFGIASLKDVDQIKAEIDNWDPRNPLTMKPFNEQRFIQVDGIILRTACLRSNAAEPRRVVLLLVISKQGTTRLLLYRWDSWRPLITIKPLRCSGQPLPPKHSFPHLLIPSCRDTSFAIVTENMLIFYDDLSSKRMTRNEVALQPNTASTEKQWVQWAKPVRHEEHRKKKEDIVLVREDGMLKTIVITHAEDKRTAVNFDPGSLNINVDTAVCMLSAPPRMGGDILIACGDATEGGVYHLVPRLRAPLTLVQPIVNCSPIIEIAEIVNRSSIPADLSQTPARGTIIAATGLHEGRSHLAELRYGLHSRISWAIKHEDASSIDRIWALERANARQLLLLASHPESTTFLSYGLESDELASVDATSYPQMCFNEPTVAASSLPEDGILQITTSGLYILGPSGDSSCHTFPGILDSILQADIHPPSGAFVLTGRREEGVQLCGGTAYTTSAAKVEISMLAGSGPLNYLPVDLSFQVLDEHAMCLVAAQDGTLHLYKVETTAGFVHTRSWSIMDLFTNIEQPSISSIALLDTGKPGQALILCGLRTGVLLTFEASMKHASVDEGLSLKTLGKQSLGSTAVTIRVEAKPPNLHQRNAFLTCGRSLYRIESYANRRGADFAVDALLITNGVAPITLPSDVHAVDRISNLACMPEHELSGLLVCVSGEDLLLLGLGSRMMMPRPLSSMSPSRTFVFSRQLGRCISSHNPPGVSDDRPFLCLHDVTGSGTVVDATAKPRFHIGEKGEKIRSILSWQPTDGDTKFDMIVMGSDLGADGRIAYMKVKHMLQPGASRSGRVVATYLKKTINAICAFGQSSLLVCAGRDLKLLHLEMKSKRWQHTAEFELPSRALSMQAKGSVIYVATALHSFMLIRIEGNRIQQIASDSWAGLARNIVPYGQSSTLVNLVTDHGSRLLNFAEQPVRGMSPTFEATLPQAINRLVQLEASVPMDGRTRFLGSTIDGTVYLLTSLTEAEMKLLRFLDQLCEPIRDQARKAASMLGQTISRKYAGKLEAAGIPASAQDSTHARGDKLKALLQPGPYNLEYLLKRRFKLEDEMVKEEDELEWLKDAARPVLGSTEEVIDGVKLWLRRLLNAPSL